MGNVLRQRATTVTSLIPGQGLSIIIIITLFLFFFFSSTWEDLAKGGA